MRTIYTPTGRALEYSPLALNLYQGCGHRCRYCYAPRVMRTTREEFAARTSPRPGVLEALEKKAPMYRADPRRVLLCFMCDPYQPSEAAYRVTGQALGILNARGVAANVLTKNPGLAINLDLKLLVKAKTWLGTTVVFMDDDDRATWEPDAPNASRRIAALADAKAAGLRTWMSLEPVMDPRQSLHAMEAACGVVDEFKVGRLNHDEEIGRTINWQTFALDVLATAQRVGANVTLNHDLVKVLPEDVRAAYLAAKLEGKS